MQMMLTSILFFIIINVQAMQRKNLFSQELDIIEYNRLT